MSAIKLFIEKIGDKFGRKPDNFGVKVQEAKSKMRADWLSSHMYDVDKICILA